MVKKIYKVKGMHCVSCAKMIELDLEDKNVSAKCDFAKETLEVEYDDSKLKEEDVRNVVIEAGYSLLS